jgi:hypothetical protein
MELPAGVNPVDVSDIDQRRYILKLNKSLHGLKQAGFNGSKKYKRDSLLKTLFKVKLISVFSFVRTVSFLHMLMTVVSLVRT